MNEPKKTQLLPRQALLQPLVNIEEVLGRALRAAVTQGDQLQQRVKLLEARVDQLERRQTPNWKKGEGHAN